MYLSLILDFPSTNFMNFCSYERCFSLPLLSGVIKADANAGYGTFFIFLICSLSSGFFLFFSFWYSSLVGWDAREPTQVEMIAQKRWNRSLHTWQEWRTLLLMVKGPFASFISEFLEIHIEGG